MVTPPTTIQQQDHDTYLRDIDDLFSYTSGALSELWTTMQVKGDVNRLVFANFYNGFHNLFVQTSKMKAMRDFEKDLINKIEFWLDYRHPITKRRVEAGRELFIEWGNALEARGLHTFQK
jgi:hypothetical protein